jgi:transcriptional regulator with XRE-family HTH domain
MPPKVLGEFILEEMRRRGMSAREFADLVGVAHTIVNKFLNHGISEMYGDRKVGQPSLDFLEKLSRATNTDICYLISLVAPEAVRVTNPDIDALALSRRIEQLPDNAKEVIDAIIDKYSSK